MMHFVKLGKMTRISEWKKEADEGPHFSKIHERNEQCFSSSALGVIISFKARGHVFKNSSLVARRVFSNN